ncbi:hypothetical protein DFH09DRAFT_1093237 [Mycena vulgaris]|nr:hypothetical protein DFH09DRAFT_1093237 [Mycena vulgaris]
MRTGGIGIRVYHCCEVLCAREGWGGQANKEPEWVTHGCLLVKKRNEGQEHAPRMNSTAVGGEEYEKWEQSTILHNGEQVDRQQREIPEGCQVARRGRRKVEGDESRLAGSPGGREEVEVVVVEEKEVKTNHDQIFGLFYRHVPTCLVLQLPLSTLFLSSLRSLPTTAPMPPAPRPEDVAAGLCWAISPLALVLAPPLLISLVPRLGPHSLISLFDAGPTPEHPATACRPLRFELSLFTAREPRPFSGQLYEKGPYNLVLIVSIVMLSFLPPRSRHHARARACDADSLCAECHVPRQIGAGLVTLLARTTKQSTARCVLRVLERAGSAATDVTVRDKRGMPPEHRVTTSSVTQAARGVLRQGSAHLAVYYTYPNTSTATTNISQRTALWRAPAAPNN